MHRHPHQRRETGIDPGTTGIQYFELAEDLAAGDKARAFPLRFDANATPPEWKKIDDEKQRRYIHDRLDGTGAATGEKVACVWLSRARRWELMIRTLRRPAYLTATLNQGGTAAARFIDWDGDAWVLGETFTVRDFYLNTSESIPANVKFFAERIGAIWVCTGPYCAASNTIPS